VAGNVHRIRRAKIPLPGLSRHGVFVEIWGDLARGAFGPPDLAGDRPGIADCLDEMHAIADLKLVEIALHQAVAVEIELRPFMRQDKAVVLIRVKL
jgi:hypothetical protein